MLVLQAALLLPALLLPALLCICPAALGQRRAALLRGGWNEVNSFGNATGVGGVCSEAQSTSRLGECPGSRARGWDGPWGWQGEQAGA